VAAIDIRKLRPSELCKLLNSTPMGEVISERQLHRHRVRAGYRIGDGRHVDLFRYAAWLVEVRHTPRPEPAGDPYEELKERARARNAALSLAGRDIGELPPVVNPERKERAERDFRFFCESYFPFTFYLVWSSDHLRVTRTSPWPKKCPTRICSPRTRLPRRSIVSRKVSSPWASTT
jgi:hypothetical protein